MSRILEGIDRRTQMAGENRVELLLFGLGGSQKYAINVFKVREVLHCPKLTIVPQCHPWIAGLVDVRGQSLPVIDLAMAIGCTPVENVEEAFMIVAEYNQMIQGFLVDRVDHIIHKQWDEIKTPPRALNSKCLTAVTRHDDEFVEIIDVEHVLQEVIQADDDLSLDVKDKANKKQIDNEDLFVLIVDDSMVARKQVKKTVDQLRLKTVLVNNGREALDLLKHWKSEKPFMLKNLLMVISDVEMPEMDGYTLATEIRKDQVFGDLYIILHTSLSGMFNQAMIEKVGANQFLSKYNPDVLANAIMARMEEYEDAA